MDSGVPRTADADALCEELTRVLPANGLEAMFQGGEGRLVRTVWASVLQVAVTLFK